MPQRPLIPWYDKTIQTDKGYIRYCEGFWVRSGWSIHIEMFQVARLNVQDIFATAKSQYYNSNIKEHKDNQSTVFGGVNKVLHLNQTAMSKMIETNNDMTHEFNNILSQKVTNNHCTDPPRH